MDLEQICAIYSVGVDAPQSTQFDELGDHRQVWRERFSHMRISRSKRVAQLSRPVPLGLGLLVAACSGTIGDWEEGSGGTLLARMGPWREPAVGPGAERRPAPEGPEAGAEARLATRRPVKPVASSPYRRGASC